MNSATQVGKMPIPAGKSVPVAHLTSAFYMMASVEEILKVNFCRVLCKRSTGGIELLSSYAGSSTKREFGGIPGGGGDIGHIRPTIVTRSAAASFEHHIREKGCDVIWTGLGLLSSLPRFPKIDT